MELVRGEDAVHDVGIARDEGSRGGEALGLENDEASDGGAALEERAGEAHAPGARERAEVLEVGGPVHLAELRGARTIATDEREERHRADSIRGTALRKPLAQPATRAGFPRRRGSVTLSG